MYAKKTVIARLLLLAVFAMSVVACGGGDPLQEVDAWTLGDREVHLPAHVDEQVAGAPSFTLRSRVTLSPGLRGGPLTLAITWLPALASLRVDGRDVPALDTPLTDRFRTAGAHRWRIPDDLAQDPTLDLELRVDNGWTQAAWLDDPPRLSRTTDGDRAFLATYAFDQSVALLGVPTIALLTLLYMALYLRDRSRHEHGWFALEGVGALWYPAMMGGLAQTVLGRFDAAVAGPSLAFSAVATVHFTNAYLRLPRPSRAWWAGLAVVVAAGVFRGGPFHATRWVAPPTIAMLFANAVYHVVLLRRLLRAGKPRPTNLFIITLSWPLAVLVGSTDFAGWLGLGDPFAGVRAGSLGISAVAILQSIALSREHVKSLREVEVLNEELRRQVAARSRQLADALARLGAAPRRTAPLAPGDEVDGRYRVVRELGQGGAGRVYEVERRADGLRLALKVVMATTDPMMLARAAREAQLVSEVRHANVVSIVDVDVSTEGTLFLVMELVDGRTLHEERARFGDAAWALPLLRQLAEGLAAIHAQGIVHRDLKPANVLLAGPAGEPAAVVKIADFGIANVANDDVPEPARALGEDELTVADRVAPATSNPTITETGDLLGTPHYMAPEIVALGIKAAQPPADVFAFGVIAFEMLAGRRPYEKLPTFLGLALAPPPPSFASFAPSLPETTAKLLDACLSREPGDRPTAHELARALVGAVS